MGGKIQIFTTFLEVQNNSFDSKSETPLNIFVQKGPLLWLFIFLFQLSIVFAAVFCIIVLRIVLIQVMHDTTNAAENIDFFAKYAKLIGVGLAASVNAFVIEVMSYGFQATARKLTDFAFNNTYSSPVLISWSIAFSLTSFYSGYFSFGSFLINWALNWFISWGRINVTGKKS